nr:ATP-binding cassette domain-containing protein [Anaeromonas gelatinilytica]
MLGSNGTGKTTIVKILTTLLKQDSGTVIVNGFDVAAKPGNVRQSISLTGQFAAVDEILTGRENLIMIAKLRHLKNPRQVADDLLNRFGLTAVADRNDFQRLLSDIRTRKINCVIIKDLSCLSRDYVEVGILIDRLFVQMNVRFISLHERIDSYNDPESVSSMVVPITNVMNDQYCYQTSKKIRQMFDYKKCNGQFIGSYAPYGYIKDPNDKHALLVDHEAAEVVKQIFAMFLNGMAVRAIVNHLNDHGVMCPSLYKQS